jgi:SAM-dependent methyltransferase
MSAKIIAAIGGVDERRKNIRGDAAKGRLAGPRRPQEIGALNFNSIIENLPLRRDYAVLDFGCGIGRTSVYLADFFNEGGSVVGSDIVPGWIQFCQEQFAQAFPNATFFCVKANHPHFDDAANETMGATPVIDEEQFFKKYHAAFDMVAAFSVFTHFDPTMTAHYLEYLRAVTKLSGHLFLTWFLDHPCNPAESRLGPNENFRDRDGKLRFAIFSLSAVADLARNTGLAIECISYGYWRNWPPNALKGQHGQDIVILRPA